MKTLSVLIAVLLLFSCKKDEFNRVPASGMLNSTTNDSKPNVIIILADDVGYEVPGYTGGQTYQTPYLDYIAQSSMKFTQNHSCPLCSPSRVQILTGKYNYRNYVDWGDMKPTEKTLGNLFKDAGYRTGFFGKDQLGGGGVSLTSWGFDEYCVHDPLGSAERGPRYKSPSIYTHGNFLPEEVTHNKYGPDIIQDSLFSFIDKNVENGRSFFAFYPIILAHKPFQPTPDNAEFATWTNLDSSNDIFYPSMIKYMDKLIGQLTIKLYDDSLLSNTYVFFLGDNGTPGHLISMFNGQEYLAGKGKTTEPGTHVPLLVFGGNTARGTDSSLIDFTDYFSTLADLTNSSTSEYAPLDGMSFFHNIQGTSGINRESIFCHFDPHPEKDDDDPKSLRFTRWAQTTTYKKYDTIAFPERKIGKFINFTKDIYEKESSLYLVRKPTAKEKQIDSMLQAVINKNH